MTKVDVLIVGAGPTGLMMAAELVRYGLTCRIIDKAEAPSVQSKAIAIQARTLEVLHQAGLVEPFLQDGLKITGACLSSNQRPIAKINLEHIQSPYPFVLSLEQSQTEAILTRHLKRSGLRIERGVELVDFDEHDSYIQAYLRRPGADETILADWLIGCDGAHSIVRKRIGATFKGKLFKDIFSLADVDIHWDRPHDQVTAFTESQGIIAALPLPGESRYRLIFQLKRCRNLLQSVERGSDGLVSAAVVAPPTLEEAKDLLSACAGKQIEVENPTWLANFHINSRLASTYRKGRVFLAGDAAHIHSPVGGQGMNTGIQDAFNLAWKLAWVQQKKAPPVLLDSYGIERHWVGTQLLKFTEWASEAVTLHNPFLVKVRNFIVRHLSRWAFVQKKVTAALSENNICYPHSPLNREEGQFFGTLKVGDRAPDGIVIYDDKITTLFDLWEGSTKGIILLFAGEHEPFKKLANELEEAYPVQVFIIAATPDANVCTDPDLKVHETYGVDGPAIYWIRPDLYIGYRQTGVDPQGINNYLR